MKNLLVLALLGAIAWFGYGKYKTMSAVADAVSVPVYAPVSAQEKFSCDGRTHCSQMRSCAEATYFLRHCPNTKMDGNNDGVPCERQWCK